MGVIVCVSASTMTEEQEVSVCVAYVGQIGVKKERNSQHLQYILSPSRSVISHEDGNVP